MKKNRSEYDEQKALFDWAEMMSVQIPELKLLHSSQNGVNYVSGKQFKKNSPGVKSGVPDVFLPVARGKFNGLFIELKKVGGRNPEGKQKQWLIDLSAQGYATYCCKGSEAAIQTIVSYLNE